ncbi:hypothetical protein ACJJTC_005283 [Scirpophaga incertulas]
MNFNASRNVGQSGGIRKAKRVSDVAAMGAPSPVPQYAPAPGYSSGFAPAGPPPPYQEGIQLETSQDFGQSPPNFGFGFQQAPMASPSQLGSMLHQPVVQDMAYAYGNQLASQGREVVSRELGRFVSESRLRYYFAVDTRYVLKKLLLILFPFTHKEWMVKYDEQSPVQPRFDVNAPDLYIPAMGYVTYVLLTGFILGLQHRFSPEQISIQASSALAHIVFEVAVYLLTLLVAGVGRGPRALALLALAGYKYCTMIAALLAALLAGRAGYYAALAYCSVALSYFLVKSLRVQVLSGAQAPADAAYGAGTGAGPYAPQPYAEPYSGTKRRIYFLLFVGVAQPLISWWLTYRLLPAPTPAAAVTPAPLPTLPTR